MSTPNTFLGLIKNYRVEIPLLQRDFAQGRSEKEDKKAPSLRKRFVEELFKALRPDAPSLELDFIYGPILKDADGEDVFIPLDGQQRLTTLFLLHWYVAKREEIPCPDLSKFTYKVRTTTQEFLTALLDINNKGGRIDLGRLSINNGKITEPVKKEVTDAAWYYSAWDMDPSVQGMLNMLDAIHAEYGKQSEHLCDRLENITFQLLNMGEYGLADDLYMKMNARGVPLTDFENFKSWLTDQCTAVASDNAYFYTGDDLEKQKQSWNWKIDKEWADFFWSLRDPKADEIDAAFLRFFKAVALNAYAEYFPEEKNIDGKDDSESAYRNNISRLNKDEYIPLAEYSELFNLTRDETLRSTFSMLDRLASAGKESLADSLKKIPLFISEKEEPPLIGLLTQRMFTYSGQVLFYGMFLYLGKENAQISDPEFKEWLRVVRNLVVNSQIDSPQTFVPAIKGLTKLYDAANGGILDYLAGTPAPKIDFFRDTQVKEEIQKAKLLLSDKSKSPDEWRAFLQESENHPLFEGQIGFLLRKSAGDFSDWLSIGDLEVFKSRAAHAAKLWDGNGAVFDRADPNHNHLLFRALLASGCLNRSGWEIDLTNNKANWKRLLRGEVIPPAILGLLDCFFEQGKEVLGSLQGVIKQSNPEHNLSHYITGNEKDVPYSLWLYAKCHKNLADGVLELRKSKGAWTQNRYFLSGKRDQLVCKVFDILEKEGAVFVDLAGKTRVTKPDSFLEEWLTVGLPVKHTGGEAEACAYIAYTTDGLTHEIGVRKDRKASSEKSVLITERVRTCIGSGLEGITVEKDNWWWYAYGKIENPNAETIAEKLQTLYGKVRQALAPEEPAPVDLAR